MMEFSLYHKLLRVSSLLVACVLTFQSGILSDLTAQLADNTQVYLANSVGVYVGVAPTELNQITAALTEREYSLAQREDAIAEREIDIGLAPGENTRQETTTFVLEVVLFILVILILLNYALDFIRARELALRTSPESTAS